MAHRSRFRAFIASRLGSDAEADDILQNGLVKALRRVDEMPGEEKLTAWFFQVLRNTLIDHARSRKASARREESWMMHQTLAADRETHAVICACYDALLPQLKSRDAELLRRVELNDEAVAAVATELGMTPNSASVALHRARNTLRQLLEQFCGDCARNACLDCDCESSPNGPGKS